MNTVTKLFLVIAAIFAIVWISFLGQKANPRRHQTIEITIPKQASAAQVIQLLKTKQLIKNPLRTKLAMKLLRADQHIQAGAYYLQPDMTLWSVIRAIQGKGKATTRVMHMITIPEGLTIREIANVFHENKIANRSAFIKAVQKARAHSLTQKEFPFLAEIPIAPLEGYLFPDTYVVEPNTPPDRLVTLMMERFQEIALPLFKQYPHSKYNLHELLTIASVVEKEAVSDDERPIVSSVYHNRLGYRMYMASCPTVKYALGKPRKPNLYFKDLEVQSPYNTYKNLGLPPGPICSPGKKSILAALQPAKTKYLYFAAKGDGTNIFTKSSQEHYRLLRRLGYVQGDIAPKKEEEKNKRVPIWYQK